MQVRPSSKKFIKKQIQQKMLLHIGKLSNDKLGKAEME